MHSAPAPCEEIYDSLLEEKKIRLWIKREDLLHPEISGNKWRKLKYNFLRAKEEGTDTILTFGGAYSNHIFATAAAASENGFKSIGIIRGEEHLPLNATLDFATRHGMRLIYWSREAYRNKSSEMTLQALQDDFGPFYLVPEGGTNEQAIKGCSEITSEIDQDFDVICCSVGTGGTLAGLISGMSDKKKQVIGFSALKGDFLHYEIDNLLSANGRPDTLNWKIMSDYHFNGYAKISELLIDFIRNFERQHQLLFDPIYTGKMMFGVLDLIKKDYFSPGSKIIALHTGGLQGWKGIIERYKTKPGYDFSFTEKYIS